MDSSVKYINNLADLEGILKIDLACHLHLQTFCTKDLVPSVNHGSLLWVPSQVSAQALTIKVTCENNFTVVEDTEGVCDLKVGWQVTGQCRPRENLVGEVRETADMVPTKVVHFIWFLKTATTNNFLLHSAFIQYSTPTFNSLAMCSTSPNVCVSSVNNKILLWDFVIWIKVWYWVFLPAPFYFKTIIDSPSILPKVGYGHEPTKIKKLSIVPSVLIMVAGSPCRW